MSESDWRFELPLAIARVLSSFDRPWFIAAGWALDLFLGRVTRSHDDIEFSILRRDQLALRRYLAGYTFRRVLPTTHEVTVWCEGEWLAAPVHEIHASTEQSEPAHFEILLNESDGQDWRFRRHLAITRPLSMLGVSSALGVPVLRPEIVLLYKARDCRPKDLNDFSEVRPAMDDESRLWLAHALEACYPSHAWLELL